MLRGSHLSRVDEKGRLKVPIEFKRELDERYGQEFFITSFDGERAQIFPMPEWIKIEETMASRPSSDEKEKFQFWTNYFGGPATMDGQGRLLLPQNLREKAGLTGELAVLGLQNRIVAVVDERELARLKASPLTGADFTALAIPGM